MAVVVYRKEQVNNGIEYYKPALSGEFMKRACAQVNKSPVHNFDIFFGADISMEKLYTILWLCRE